MDVNPFLVDYDTKENKITALLMHVVQKCDCAKEFLHFALNVPNEHNEPNYEYGLQLQGEFPYPVKRGFIIPISNLNTPKQEVKTTSNSYVRKLSGYPDAFLYDRNTETLVLIESKVERGRIVAEQLRRHQQSVPYLEDKDWHVRDVLVWQEVLAFFMQQLRDCRSERDSYIISNFADVLRKDVICPTQFIEEDLLDVAERCGVLGVVRAIMEELKTYKGWHAKNFTTREVRFFSTQLERAKYRFVTFVLSGQQARLILHPGESRGVEWRSKIGTLFKQSDTTVLGEVSIPLNDINEDLQVFRFRNGDTDLRWQNLRWLIERTVEVNSALRGRIFRT